MVTEQLLRRVRGEYLEMPGLSLTMPQAQRLLGLDRDTCAALLGRLVTAGFLRRTLSQTFVLDDASRQRLPGAIWNGGFQGQSWSE